jgi:hypothetical protein
MTTKNAKLLTFALSFCTLREFACHLGFDIWNLASVIASSSGLLDGPEENVPKVLER